MAGQVLLIIEGTVMLAINGRYFVQVWSSLHEQGIGHLYLVITSFVGLPWLTVAAGACFLGYYWLPDEGAGLTVRAVALPLLGVVVSILGPNLMLSVWFVAVVWVRSLL